MSHPVSRWHRRLKPPATQMQSRLKPAASLPTDVAKVRPAPFRGLRSAVAGGLSLRPRGVLSACRPLTTMTAILLLLVSTACNPGAYPVDAFNEMHYSPAHRRLEPDRLASPPDAVPRSGGAPDYTWDQASTLGNPIVRNPQNLQRAAQLYQVNCAACHGVDGHAQTTVADHFKRAGFVPPVDLADARVRDRTDGQLYWIVGHGLGDMPAFRRLLTDDELWTVVYFVRQVQGA